MKATRMRAMESFVRSSFLQAISQRGAIVVRLLNLPFQGIYLDTEAL
jgi:hypothetical protein